MVLPDDYGVGEMQIIVVSNSPSKRIEYFVEAGRSLQTGVRFMTYEELFNCLPSLRQAVVKLEPWVSCETDFLKYTLFNDEYKRYYSGWTRRHCLTMCIS